jgi:hypothetical protein
MVFNLIFPEVIINPLPESIVMNMDTNLFLRV